MAETIKIIKININDYANLYTNRPNPVTIKGKQYTWDPTAIYVNPDTYEQIGGTTTSIVNLKEKLEAAELDIVNTMADLEQTAADLSDTKQNLEAEIENRTAENVQIKKTTDALSTTVTDHTTEISRVSQTSDKLTAAVFDGETNRISQLEQTAESIKATVEDPEHGLSVVEQKADSITSTVGNLTKEGGRISQIEQTASGLFTTVGNLDSRVSTAESTISQQATKIAAKVSETGGGEEYGFGWSLKSTGFTLQSDVNGTMTDVFTVDTTGNAKLTGEIEAKKGQFGIFTIGDTGSEGNGCRLTTTGTDNDKRAEIYTGTTLDERPAGYISAYGVSVGDTIATKKLNAASIQTGSISILQPPEAWKTTTLITDEIQNSDEKPILNLKFAQETVKTISFCFLGYASALLGTVGAKVKILEGDTLYNYIRVRVNYKLTWGGESSEDFYFYPEDILNKEAEKRTVVVKSGPRGFENISASCSFGNAGNVAGDTWSSAIEQSKEISDSIIGLDGHFLPQSDGDYNLGADDYKWKQVFAINSEINTSDLALKEDIKPLKLNYESIFDDLKPISYKLIGNKHDRTHIGFIAQEVEKAVLDHGLSSIDFAALCYDVNEQGIKENYGLRYSEFIALNTDQIQKLKKRTAILETENIELKERLEAIENRLNN